jgi:hypothetical protein
MEMSDAKTIKLRFVAAFWTYEILVSQKAYNTIRKNLPDAKPGDTIQVRFS